MSLCNCSLFNDAVTQLMQCRVILNLKECRKKGSCQNLRHSPGICEKKTPPEYKTEVLLFEITCSDSFILPYFCRQFQLLHACELFPTNWTYSRAVEWQWRPSASGLMSSQVGDHLTPFSYSYNCRLKSRNDSLSSFYSLGTVRMENSYNSCSVVVFMSVTAITWRLLRHCIAKSMFVEPFHSNGRLCWLYNSGFQQNGTKNTKVDSNYILFGLYLSYEDNFSCNYATKNWKELGNELILNSVISMQMLFK